MSKKIYIKTNMTEVPESCRGCDKCGRAILKHVNFGACLAMARHTKESNKLYEDIDDIDERPDWCPLVEAEDKEE